MIGIIRNIIKHSSVDGPGNRFVVFLQGCPMNCRYCHNPETIPFINQLESKEASELITISSSSLVGEILKYKDYISGVTFSGGECTSQFDFIIDVSMELKRLGVHVLIDTNGLLETNKMIELSNEVDGIMLDLKALNPKTHKDITGVDNELVLNNFKALIALNKIYEIRTVIIPGVVDDHAVLNWVKENHGEQIRYKLIALRNHGVRESLPEPSVEYMHELRRYAENLGFTNIILIGIGL